MKYRVEVWTISQLIELYEAKKLELNPPYQRNPIWSSAAQKELIESILRTRPMPSFFLLERNDGTLEVVDGKQRALTIFAFWRGHLETLDGRTIDAPAPAIGAPTIKDSFRAYIISVTLITDLALEEPIETFYSLVNSTGLRLNRPEIRKADFYTTNLLRLVTNLAGQKEFEDLGLFTRLSAQRMNDVDFVSELVAQMKFGVSDKKEKVDDLYESDIDDAEFDRLRAGFLRVVQCISAFEDFVPISKTRYRQKNDFYTLFGFIHFHSNLEQSTLDYLYRVLVKIAPYIRPSQDRCEPLKTYALNCVTQSNSKRAREDRLGFFESLLLNTKDIPNDAQAAILRFFKLNADSLTKITGYTTLRHEDLLDPDQREFPL